MYATPTCLTVADSPWVKTPTTISSLTDQYHGDSDYGCSFSTEASGLSTASALSSMSSMTRDMYREFAQAVAAGHGVAVPHQEVLHSAADQVCFPSGVFAFADALKLGNDQITLAMETPQTPVSCRMGEATQCMNPHDAMIDLDYRPALTSDTVSPVSTQSSWDAFPQGTPTYSSPAALQVGQRHAGFPVCEASPQNAFSPLYRREQTTTKAISTHLDVHVKNEGVSPWPENDVYPISSRLFELVQYGNEIPDFHEDQLMQLANTHDSHIMAHSNLAEALMHNEALASVGDFAHTWETAAKGEHDASSRASTTPVPKSSSRRARKTAHRLKAQAAPRKTLRLDVQHYASGRYECPHQGCGKRYPKEERLNRHLVTHLPPLPLKCCFCNSVQNERRTDNVGQHLRRHGDKVRKAKRLTTFALANTLAVELKGRVRVLRKKSKDPLEPVLGEQYLVNLRAEMESPGWQASPAGAGVV